ncbi:alpha/beta hydrolase [Burkholderiaceae bacterium DAT-1]|nr:alpha/beta hydrolase [Burkholderiaceae bacterium DAT-1]
MATLVLLRGLVREQGHWGTFPAQLQAAFPACHVVTPDIAGNGSRHLERSPSTIHNMMLDVRANLLNAGMAAPFHLIALSMGGMIAMEWVHCFPDEIGKSVLINSSARTLNPFWDRLRPGNYPGLLCICLGLMDVAAREQWIFRRTCKQASSALIDRWCNIARQHPVSQLNAVRQLFAAARFKPQAPAVPSVLHCITSAGDQLVHPRCTFRMSSAWHLPVHLHPTAGHDLPADDPAWLIQTLQSILPASCINPPCS